MAGKQPPQPPSRFPGVPDRLRLGSLYRPGMLGPDGGRRRPMNGRRNPNETAMPEPEAELEDSELADADRQSAIARERMRREGRG